MDHTFLFQQPPPVYIRALPPIILLFLSYLGFSEIIGKHLQYSKFWNVNSQSKSNQIKLSSKTGMLFLYGPAFVAGVASFGLFPFGGLRFLLLKSALTIHFFKRILENFQEFKNWEREREQCWSSMMPGEMSVRATVPHPHQNRTICGGWCYCKSSANVL